MKRIFFMAMVFALSVGTGSAQPARTRIQKVREGLYFMYYDSTALKSNVTKSTIVEFEDYVALLEMPISYGGGGTKVLHDHADGGEQVFKAIQEYFPTKPLKYVLSSHWHPHSLSSIAPFISRGINIITTKKNFARLREMIDSATYEKYGEHICFVEGDSMVFRDKKNAIVAYRFNKTDYPNVPTEDYLYFYLPNYNFLHCSCMYQRIQNFSVCGKELVSGRTEDLERFIRAKNINPQNFILTDGFSDEANSMASRDTMQHFLANGMLTSKVMDIVTGINEETLLLKSDSVKKYCMTNRIMPYYINLGVYSLLKQNKLRQALALAQLLVQLAPSDAGFWDTYGEVYYILGDMQLAKFYEAQCKRIDKEFKGGGEEVWKKDVEEYKKLWEKKEKNSQR